MLDALIVGAGPAGLTAALYLARYRRRLLLVDAGDSRARYIPVSHNTPGFARGVGGTQLLEELRAASDETEREGGAADVGRAAGQLRVGIDDLPQGRGIRHDIPGQHKRDKSYIIYNINYYIILYKYTSNLFFQKARVRFFFFLPLPKFI